MNNPATPERWLPVVDWTGFYDVSDLGRVWSRPRTVDTTRGPRRIRGRMLAAGPDGGGYRIVDLKRDGSRTTYRVHTLVAEAFLGPRPPRMDVLHGPGGQLDNRAVNLSYGTRRENLLDTRRDGTNYWANRTHCDLGHLFMAPNLVPREAERGHRRCLACDRARSRVRDHRTRGTILDLQAEADRHYSLIMSEL